MNARKRAAARQIKRAPRAAAMLAALPDTTDPAGRDDDTDEADGEAR